MTRIKLLLVCAAALVVLFVAEANAAGRLVEKPLVWPGQVQQWDRLGRARKRRDSEDQLHLSAV